MLLSIRARRAAPLIIAAVVLALSGCQKLGPGTGAYHVNTQALLLERPEPNARIIAGIGTNSKVTVTETKDGYSRISIDEGRITGWVDSDVLSRSPVAEPAEPQGMAPSRKARSAGPAKPKAEPAAAPAEPPAEHQTPQAASPESPPSQPESPPPSGVMSPGEAKAAPPPAPAPAPRNHKDKQARPEAFEPF